MRRRGLVQWMLERYRVSVRRACHLSQFSRAAWYRPSRVRDQSALRRRIRELAMSRLRFGYLRIHVMLRDLSPSSLIVRDESPLHWTSEEDAIWPSASGIARSR